MWESVGSEIELSNDWVILTNDKGLDFKENILIARGGIPLASRQFKCGETTFLWAGEHLQFSAIEGNDGDWSKFELELPTGHLTNHSSQATKRENMIEGRVQARLFEPSDILTKYPRKFRSGDEYILISENKEIVISKRA